MVPVNLCIGVKIWIRYLGRTTTVAQKATDPIQQLFLNKIKEYKERSAASGSKLVDATPELENELKKELENAAKLYGAKEGEDMTAFPTFKWKEPVIDPINEQVPTK